MTESDANILHPCAGLWAVFLCIHTALSVPLPEAKLGQIYEETYFPSVAGGYMSHPVRMMDDEQMMCSG